MSTVNDIAAIDQTGAPYIIRVEPDGSRHAVPLDQAADAGAIAPIANAIINGAPSKLIVRFAPDDPVSAD